jgi:hypothetical protein
MSIVAHTYPSNRTCIQDTHFGALQRDDVDMGHGEHSPIHLALTVHYTDRLVEVEAGAAMMEVVAGAAPTRPLPFRPGYGGLSPTCSPYVAPAHPECKDGDRAAATEMALLCEKMSVRDLCCFLTARAPGTGYPR